MNTWMRDRASGGRRGEGPMKKKMAASLLLFFFSTFALVEAAQPRSLILYFKGDPCLYEYAGRQSTVVFHRAGAFVRGPANRAAEEAEEARKQFREPRPDEPKLAGQVAFYVPSPRMPSCAGFAPSEMIFVSEKDETPILRVPLQTLTQDVKNAMGGAWTVWAGFATLPVEDFRKAFSGRKTKYRVYVLSSKGRSEPAKVDQDQIDAVR